MGTRIASPRGRYGERLQRDSCLRYICKKHHPLAGDSPWRHYRRDHNKRTAGRIHHQLFFVFTDWSVWRNVHSGRNTVFLYLSWRALARRLRLCVDPCPRYLTPDDTHTIFASFVWARSTHAMSLRGEFACTVHSRLVPLFKERGVAVCFPRFGTHRCRGTEAIEIAGFAVGYGRWVREGPRTRVSCWIVTMRSFWHHQIQRLVLYWVMPRKSRRCLRARKLRLNPLNPPALHMFLEVMDHKNKFSGHKSPARASLPFFLNLDVEVEKEWKKLFFLVFIGFSILVMLTLRVCVKMAMRGCPLCKRW